MLLKISRNVRVSIKSLRHNVKSQMVLVKLLFSYRVEMHFCACVNLAHKYIHFLLGFSEVSVLLHIGEKSM